MALAGVPERHPRRVVYDELLRRIVQRHTHLRIRLYARLLQDGVHIRIGVGGVIVFAFAVEQDVQEVLRIRIVCVPAKHEHLELAPIEVLQIGCPLDLLYLDFHAQRPFPHLQYDLQVDGDVAAGAGHADHDARPSGGIGVLGFCQRLFRRLFVECQAFDVVGIAGEAWRQDAVCGDAQAGQHFVGDELFIDCQVQRAAEVHIVKRRFVHIEADVGHAEARRRYMKLGGQRFAGIL